MYKILRCLKSAFVSQGEVMLNGAAEHGYRAVYFFDSGAEIVMVMKMTESKRGRPKNEDGSIELGE